MRSCYLAIGLNKIQIGCLSRTEFTFAIESADRVYEAAEVLARNAHHAYAASAWGSGNGSNGGIVSEHEESVSGIKKVRDQQVTDFFG